MREILFRGKSIKNGEWVEGNFVEQDKPGYHTYIIKSFNRKVNKINFMFVYEFDCEAIFPETIGQYTGLRDKNGTRIFEGDIVRCSEAIIFDSDCQYCEDNVIMRVTLDSLEVQAVLTGSKSAEIIGNVYDNPELLEVR